VAYASRTEVTVDKSKGELKRVVYKSGASNYKYAEEEDRAMVMFSKEARIIRFVIKFPPPESREFTHTPGRGTKRTQAAAYKEYEAEHRRRWRALILSVKAKFESTASGIETFEEAFLAQILLPNSQTVAQAVSPSIEEAYATGKMKKIRLIPEATKNG